MTNNISSNVYEVIAAYPRSSFTIGQIIRQHEAPDINFSKYPNLFRDVTPASFEIFRFEDLRNPI